MILASASPLSLALALGAAVAYAVTAISAARLAVPVARGAVWVAWVLHGLLLGWSLLGQTPRFGFAPALSVTVWLGAAVYAVESQVFPLMRIRWTLAALGTVAIVVAYLFPGNPLHPNASPWLPLHWALGIASYGLFGVAVVHAWFMSRAEDRIRLAADSHTGMPLLTLERLTFRFVGAGFVLLSATLLVGFVFGSALYGPDKAVHWDHKTAFSVLSWLTFAVLLLGRAQFGWRGKRAVGGVYIGSGLLLLAYVGSRFVVEVILGRTL